MSRAALAAILVVLLAGCGGAGDGLIIYTDSTTGCQYLRAPDSQAITPRMSRDGTQVCVDREPERVRIKS